MKFEIVNEKGENIMRVVKSSVYEIRGKCCSGVIRKYSGAWTYIPNQDAAKINGSKMNEKTIKDYISELQEINKIISSEEVDEKLVEDSKEGV